MQRSHDLILPRPSGGSGRTTGSVGATDEHVKLLAGVYLQVL